MIRTEKNDRGKAALIVFSCDIFYEANGYLWSSPIVSASIRLFADNFARVGIVAHLSGEPPNPEKHVQWPSRYHLYPVPLVKGFRGRPRQWLRVVRLAVKLSKEYEVVYVRMFSLPALPAALYCTVFLRRPWFMSLHGDIEEVFEISKKDSSWFVRRALVKVAGFLARLVCKKPKPLFVSGPALGEKYAPQRSDWMPFMDTGIRASDLYRERLDTCQKEPYYLVYVGETSRRKGIDVLIRAIAILKQNSINVRLRYIGGGNKDWVRKLAIDLGVDGLIEFVGFMRYGEELFSCIRQGDILVVPSRGSEGWNRAITEANAQGLLVVASDVDSLGIAIRQWRCGIVVPPDDEVRLAEAIREIIESPERRRQMVVHSLERGEYYIFEKEFIRIRTKLEEEFSGRLVPLDDIPIEYAGR